LDQKSFSEKTQPPKKNADSSIISGMACGSAKDRRPSIRMSKDSINRLLSPCLLHGDEMTFGIQQQCVGFYLRCALDGAYMDLVLFGLKLNDGIKTFNCIGQLGR